MENPANDHPRVAAAALLRHYIANSGVFLISTAGAIVVVHTAGNPSAIDNDPAYALAAFLLFLLGIWLVLIALVAEQFPRAATVAVAIARAMSDYLIGGN
uniref:Uncharacterized protein n=1 Tax=Leersia perrieri TaxID=77586 RepID=A0A0D9WT65_9ORYZ